MFWWPTVNISLLVDLPFEFLEDEDLEWEVDQKADVDGREDVPEIFCQPTGVKYLDAPVCNDVYVERHLRERMARIEYLRSAVEKFKDPHISTNMHRLCASIVQVIRILRATPYE